MLIPHLHFCGECKQAIALYEKAFHTKADVVIDNRQYDPGCEEDVIAQAVMTLCGQQVYLNDRFGNRSRTTDTAVHLIVMFQTAEELLACYEVLRPGSTIIDPLEALPYSPLAVQFIDRFGVQWGFMVEAKPD